MQDDQAGFGLLLKGNQVTLRINRNGTPIDKDTGVRAVANVWQHLTVSFAQIGQAQQTGQTVTTWLAAWTQSPVGVKLTLSAAERINASSSPLTVGAATNGYAGQMDDIIVYSRPFSELEARQLANSSPSTIQKVEVGFLHRKDKDDATKVVWRDATLDRTNVDGTTWQLQAPADLEGIYDISLRASDALGNQRTLAGVWTGLIDTQAPRIVLGGTTPGQQTLCRDGLQPGHGHLPVWECGERHGCGFRALCDRCLHQRRADLGCPMVQGSIPRPCGGGSAL